MTVEGMQQSVCMQACAQKLVPMSASGINSTKIYGQINFLPMPCAYYWLCAVELLPDL